jgi:hypothetical protein
MGLGTTPPAPIFGALGVHPYTTTARGIWWDMVGHVTEFAGFHPVAPATVDDRRRISLGLAQVIPGARYTILRRGDGTIVLMPVPEEPPEART